MTMTSAISSLSTIWAVIIPAVLAIKARKKFPNQMFTVWGGNLIPAIVILYGLSFQKVLL